MRRVAMIVSVVMFTGLPMLAMAGPVSQPAVETPYISPEISADPQEGLLVDAWYRLRLVDQPMGYMRTAIQRKGDRIESLDYTQIRISRGPITIKVIIRTTTVETLDGRPVEIHTEQVLGSQPMKYDAVFGADGMIDLKITQGGNVIHRQVEADPTAVLPWKKTLDLLAGRHKPGESYTERAYAFTADTKPLEVKNAFEGKTEWALPSGQTVPVLRYKVTSRAMASAGEVLCEPRLLIPLKLDVPVISSMVLTATITTREGALAGAAEKPAELFESLMLQASVVGNTDPSQAPGVLYTMKVKGDAELVDVVPTDMQRVLSRSKDTIRLLVTRRQGNQRVPPAEPWVDPARYLAGSAYANSEDPVIQRMAREAAAEKGKPLETATALTRYVYQKMSRKTLDVAFATASEAARTLEGDCTEHAVLLAALARARNLPARAALGMVALPGSYANHQMTFGYHMWTQIQIDGRWMDFDAALNQPVPDATHIVLGISDLSDSAIPQESVKTFAQVAGSVQMVAAPRGEASAR